MLGRIRRSRAWVFLAEVLRRFADDESAVLSGYIAYASMLAGFPFLIFALTAAGALIGQGFSEQAVAVLFDAAPRHVALTLEPVLFEVIGARQGSILTLSALGTLYAASNGVEAIRIGLDRAYDVETKRHFVVNRLISIGFVLVCFLVFGVLAVLIIFAPLLFTVLDFFLGMTVPVGADPARYLVGSVLLFWMLWLMHRILPGRTMRSMVIWPGVATSMVIWILLATALSLYVAHSPSYTLTYGTLTGVIVTLLFFYATGVAIIFGAQVNAVVNFGVSPPLVPEGEGL